MGNSLTWPCAPGRRRPPLRRHAVHQRSARDVERRALAALRPRPRPSSQYDELAHLVPDRGVHREQVDARGRLLTVARDQVPARLAIPAAAVVLEARHQIASHGVDADRAVRAGQTEEVEVACERVARYRRGGAPGGGPRRGWGPPPTPPP